MAPLSFNFKIPCIISICSIYSKCNTCTFAFVLFVFLPHFNFAKIVLLSHVPIATKWVKGHSLNMFTIKT